MDPHSLGTRYVRFATKSLIVGSSIHLTLSPKRDHANHSITTSTVKGSSGP
jgi:hypothetical protein